MRQLKRYKQNLTITGDKVYSYNTHVADIDHDKCQVIVLEKYKNYSSTTSKHINYVASEFSYEVIK